MIELGPVPLGGDSESKVEYKGGHSPWGVNSESHRLGNTFLRTYMREMKPFGWLEGHWANRRVVGRLDSTHEGCMCTGLPLRQGGKRSTL